MLWTGVYQMKYCYPENTALGCNGVRNYFHGCTCQRWGVCVHLFPYQCKAKRFYPFAGNWATVTGIHSLVWFKYVFMFLHFQPFKCNGCNKCNSCNRVLQVLQGVTVL